MTRPLTWEDAQARTRVRLSDGREGELTYLPPENPEWDQIDVGRAARYSSRAKVRLLENGRYVTVDPDTLARVDDAEWEQALEDQEAPDDQ